MKIYNFNIVVFIIPMLVACGGGGSGSSETTPITPTPTPITPTPTPITPTPTPITPTPTPITPTPTPITPTPTPITPTPTPITPTPTPITPTPTPITPIPTPITPTPINWNSSASATEIDSSTVSFQKNERKILKSFKVMKEMSAELIYAAQYSADLFIMDKDEEDNFINGRSFKYYPDYSFTGNTFGISSFLLPEGEYVVGVKNKNNETNKIRYELQHVPHVEGFVSSHKAFDTVVETIKANTRFIQPFISSDQTRLVIDGGNTGGNIYLIDISEKSNFLNGRQFEYYTSCSGGSAAPGFCEAKLPAGEYGLAYENDTDDSHALVMYGIHFVPKK